MMLKKKPSELDTDSIEEVFLLAGIMERMKRVGGMFG